jgi:hypothetical protein
MTPDQLSQIKEELTRNGVMICFNGAFVHSIIEEIGNALRRYMESEETKKSAAMDVFAVYIEQAQNVRNYLARKRFEEASCNNAIIVISRQNERYVVSSGNIVDAADVEGLTALLESVIGLDQEGLRKLFREKLRAKPVEAVAQGPPDRFEVRGAGMGLIEIARRCTGPLQYAFHDVDDHHRLFCLTAIV